MSGSERLDLIYGRQFHLDDHGEPVVSVGLATGQEKFEIQSPSGVELLISGDMGTRIAGAKRWQVHRAKTKRAQVRYAVVLRQYATLDSKVRESANQHFQELD